MNFTNINLVNKTTIFKILTELGRHLNNAPNYFKETDNL